VIRTQNLNRDLLTLEDLQAEQHAPAAAVPAPAPVRAQRKAKTGRTKTTKARQPQKKSTRKR
jgi:hypothetical protein